MHRTFSLIVVLLAVSLSSCSNQGDGFQPRPVEFPQESSQEVEVLARSIFDFAAARNYEQANENLKKLFDIDRAYAHRIKDLKEAFERANYHLSGLQAIGSRDELTSEESAEQMEEERMAAFRDAPIVAGLWKQSVLQEV